jgi:hypothetical protein
VRGSGELARDKLRWVAEDGVPSEEKGYCARCQLGVGFVGYIHCWRWPSWKLTRLKIGEDQRRPKRKSRPESHGVVAQANGLLLDGICLWSRGACSS